MRHQAPTREPFPGDSRGLIEAPRLGGPSKANSRDRLLVAVRLVPVELDHS
jgi:hypothetical protein